MLTKRVIVRLNRALWRWFELAGRCHVYAEAGDLPDDEDRDLWDGRELDPGEVWVVNGIEAIERYLALRSPRS